MVRNETADPQDEKPQRNERGGQTEEDRAKGLDSEDSGPFGDRQDDSQKQ